jgi:hypothetical protein
MKSLIFLLALFSLLAFSSALVVDFDCPEKVSVNEEFSCSLKVSEGEGTYDVKVELQKDGKSVARILQGESWKSAFYYVAGFIEHGEEKDLQIKIEQEGDFDGVLKLRQGKKVESFTFELRVGEERVATESEVEEPPQETVSSEVDVSSSEEDTFAVELPQEIALTPLDSSEHLLSSASQEESFEEMVFESRESQVLRYLPFAFLLFLGLLAVVHLWQRWKG